MCSATNKNSTKDKEAVNKATRTVERRQIECRSVCPSCIYLLRFHFQKHRSKSRTSSTRQEQSKMKTRKRARQRGMQKKKETRDSHETQDSIAKHDHTLVTNTSKQIRSAWFVAIHIPQTAKSRTTLLDKFTENTKAGLSETHPKLETAAVILHSSDGCRTSYLGLLMEPATQCVTSPWLNLSRTLAPM